MIGSGFSALTFWGRFWCGSIRKLFQIISNLIPHSAEYRESFLLGTLYRGGIFKTAMDGNRFAGVEWTAFLRVVADGKDVIELLAGEFIDALGTVAGNVDAELAHRRNGLGPYGARFGSGAEHLEMVPRVVTQKPFGHLAAG
jgi:hypothetical protein